MSGNLDDAKGRVKEAAGALTNDDGLRREGKVDQAAGKLKDAASELVEKGKQVAEKLVGTKKP